MKLEINEEVENGLVIASLNESISMLENELKKIKKVKNKKPYQVHDLEDNLLYLDALKRTRYYYGGVKYAYS
jgi:cell division protein FtsB